MIARFSYSKALALSVLVATLGLAWFACASPILSAFGEINDDIEARRLLLGKYEAVLSGGHQWQSPQLTLASARQQGEFLDNAPAAIVAANLQSRIAGLAQTSQLQVLSTQTLPPKAEGMLLWIGISVSVTGAPEDLAKVISAVEAEKPFLFIDGLVINGQEQGGGVTEHPPLIMAEFNVYGAVLSDSDESGAGP